MRLFFASVAVISLLGCEDKPSQKPLVDDKQSDIPLETTADKNTGEDSKEPVRNEISVEDLETGQYLLRVSAGEVGLVSNWSSRVTILEDMARQIGFELGYTGDSDSFVVVDRPMGGMAGLLAALLGDVRYQAEYDAEARDNGFRISSLKVGSTLKKDAAIGGEIFSQSLVELADVIPQAAGEINLGSDPDDADLATRLQFGSIEEQTKAIGELTIDPAGLNAAYQVYTQTISAEVRIAVLELIESEENYLARLMTVLSLQSADPREAMAALSIVDSMDDFSLAPQVDALRGHHDAEVRELATEVLQSITSDYDRSDEIGSTPVINDSRNSSSVDGGSGGKR